MPRDEREPQSYGSGKDWVTGRTGQQVNDPKGTPEPEHRDFYDDRRESEASGPAQGGLTSDVQLAESDPREAGAGREVVPVQKVTNQPGGAKRDSYFKKRDYD